MSNDETKLKFVKKSKEIPAKCDLCDGSDLTNFKCCDHIQPTLNSQKITNADVAKQNMNQNDNITIIIIFPKII